VHFSTPALWSTTTGRATEAKTQPQQFPPDCKGPPRALPSPQLSRLSRALAMACNRQNPVLGSSPDGQSAICNMLQRERDSPPRALRPFLTFNLQFKPLALGSSPWP
jgi:hypothetical protein